MKLNLIKEQRMKNKKISVIIPVYKAENFIKKNLEEMKKSISKTFPNHEIIAVIDGEVDKSKEEASKVEGITVLSYKENKGKGYALTYGFNHCTGDFVTFIDCDMDIHPDQLKNFIPYMTTADLVIGSKRHPFSKLHYPLIRRILSVGFRLYSWTILGVKLRDTQSGLKLIKREVLEVIMPLMLVKRYAMDIELCFLAQKHGFRTVEAPLHIDFQIVDGKSTAGSFNTIKGMFLDVLAIRYRYTFKHYYQRAFHKNMGWQNGDNYSDIIIPLAEFKSSKK